MNPFAPSEPCVQCGQVETTTLICPTCRAHNLAEKTHKSIYPSPKEQKEIRQEIRTKRTAWLKGVAAQKGCRICGETEKKFLMWEPIPTYKGPSLAVAINRCWKVERFQDMLKSHVVICWNHYFGLVAPDALYPSKHISR